eukprot:41346_1
MTKMKDIYVTDIYVEALTNQSFLVLFVISQITLLASNHWAQTTTSYAGTEKSRNYFSDTCISFVHALVTSIACTVQLLFNTQFTRMMYSYSAVLSCAYLIVHTIFYVPLDTKNSIVYLLHHVLSFMAILPITNANAHYLQDSECGNVVYFVSAGLHLVEVSTLWLDARIFCALFGKARFYFVSTLGLVGTYFPLRCVWLGYVIHVIIQSKDTFETCFGEYALHILLSTFGFIWLMSFGYSITLLQDGSNLFRLKHYKQNC